MSTYAVQDLQRYTLNSMPLLNGCKHAPGRLWHPFARRREGSPQSTHGGGGQESSKQRGSAWSLLDLDFCPVKCCLTDRQYGSCPHLSVDDGGPTLSHFAVAIPAAIAFISFGAMCVCHKGGRDASEGRAARLPQCAGSCEAGAWGAAWEHRTAA